jgi:hypothetical protein
MADPIHQLEEGRLLELEREVQRLAKEAERASRESQNLKWLLIGLMLLGGGAAAVFSQSGLLSLEAFSPGIAKTLQAKEFGLFNRDGNRVLLTDCDKFGYPNAIFMDLNKNYRMAVKVWPEGGGTPGLVFYDGSGIRGHLRLDENGSSVLRLNGEGQRGGITLRVTAEGDPSLILTDKVGNVIHAIPEGATEFPTPEPSRSGLSPSPN